MLPSVSSLLLFLASILLSCQRVETGQADGEESIPSSFQAPSFWKSNCGGARQAGRSPEGQLSTSEVPYSLGSWSFPLLGTRTACSNPGLSQRVRPLGVLGTIAPFSLLPHSHNHLLSICSMRPSRGGIIRGRGLALVLLCCKTLSPGGPWSESLGSHENNIFLPGCLMVSPGWSVLPEVQ